MSGHDRGVRAGDLAARLDSTEGMFAPGELAYLALTSKIERPLQDRLAWSLHAHMPGLVVSREWRATDIAVLAPDGEAPVALLEAKAMYSFDLTEHNPMAVEYPQLIRKDITKARRLDPDGRADVYALALV